MNLFDKHQILATAALDKSGPLARVVVSRTSEFQSILRYFQSTVSRFNAVHCISGYTSTEIRGCSRRDKNAGATLH